jgi:hypothetical protein
MRSGLRLSDYRRFTAGDRMTIELMGFITLLVGFLSLFMGGKFAVYSLVIFTLFGASAAVILTAMSNANIQPAHLLLGFLVTYFATRKNFWLRAAASVTFPRAGFWLLMTVLYGIADSFLMPRLFAGLSYVYAIRAESSVGYILVPLGPSPGNLTQLIYFFGDFVCFVVFYAFASTTNGKKEFAAAALALTAANLAFAVLDLVTYWTNTAEMLAFIRNASYRMLNDTEVSGIKRIVGSFTEASQFAYLTLGLFGFTGRLWLSGVFPRLTFALAGASLLALILATSTTGYVGLGALIVISYLNCLIRTVGGQATVQMAAFVILLPIVIFVAVAILALNDAQWLYIQDLLNSMLFNKLSSDSGVERSAWNRQAITNFYDTFGLGAGIGSARASSFPIAVISSIGVVGAITYGGFLINVLFPRSMSGRSDPIEDAIQKAACSACLAWLIAASVAGSFVDLSLTFFLFAAVASAEPGLLPPIYRSRRDMYMTQNT